MRYIFLFLLAFPVLAFSQYPSTGVKQRLGYQTTADGLIFRGNGSPAFTPTGINNAWTYIDTTVGTLYNYFAGSWHELETGGGVTMPFDSVEFNTSYTSQFGTGVMAYDPDNETVSVGIDGGATLQLGQELYYPLVINKSGALIKNGTPVMVDTATITTGDHVRIMPAKNNGILPSNYIMGVATTDIENDSTGLITWFGYVREVKEEDIAQTGVTLAAGNILYISATEAGKYTNVAPSTPYHRSTIALVARRPNANNLTLLVRPWLAPRLADLSDVNTSSVTGLSVLRYNSSAGTWDASATPGIVAADTAAMLSYYLRKADTTAMLVPYQKDITLTTTGTSGAATFNGVTLNVPQYQAALTNPVTGTGTAGRVAYWSGTGTQTGSSGFTYTNTSSLVNTLKVYPESFVSGSSSTIEITDAFKIKNEYGYPTSITAYNGINFYTGNTRIIDFYYGGTSGVKLNPQNGRIGIFRTPSYSLDINATDAIRIPSGTTAQRPTGAAGVVRYNSDSLRLEYHTGTAWKGIAKTEELPAATLGFPRAAPVAVILSTYTVGSTDAWIICDYAGTVTLTLPSAASYPGREIMIKTIRDQSVVSASSNVAPIDSNTAGTAILAATAGKWATLVSTGSQWIIMQSN